MRLDREIAEMHFEMVVAYYGDEAEGPDGPKLVENWDWLESGPKDWAITWEQGPDEWAYRFSSMITEGEIDGWHALVHAECATMWALALYPY